MSSRTFLGSFVAVFAIMTPCLYCLRDNGLEWRRRSDFRLVRCRDEVVSCYLEMPLKGTCSRLRLLNGAIVDGLCEA